MMAATLAFGGRNPVTEEAGDRAPTMSRTSSPSWPPPGSTTTPASGSITPGCPRRAASAAASSPCRRASSASPSSRRRSTTPATASARRRRFADISDGAARQPVRGAAAETGGDQRALSARYPDRQRGEAVPRIPDDGARERRAHRGAVVPRHPAGAQRREVAGRLAGPSRLWNQNALRSRTPATVHIARARENTGACPSNAETRLRSRPASPAKNPNNCEDFARGTADSGRRHYSDEPAERGWSIAECAARKSDRGVGGRHASAVTRLEGC